MAEYILKQAALDALQSEGITRNMKAYKKVQDIQAAEMAPVIHATWIPVGGQHKCSHCHTVRKTDTARDHYCPNCGATMDGEEGENGQV